MASVRRRPVPPGPLAPALGFITRPTLPVVSGGAPTPEGVAPANTVGLDAYLYPPAGSSAFNLAASAATVGAGNVQAPAGLVFQLPPLNVGVVDAVTLLLNGITLSSNVTWQLLVNGLSPVGWNALTILGRDGAAAVSVDYEKCRIQIPAGGTFAVQMTNVDGASYTVGAQVHGWFWPLALGGR